MNPEFRRNLWLELSPRRIFTMTAILLLIFFAAAVSIGGETPANIAVFLYYFIVVLWGTRNAALSVVGEIRDRTWDFQRLSSLGAGEMTWGKLFGATAFNWYGGAICLVVILADRFSHQGALVAFLDLVYYVVVGLIAQSTALLASLIAAMRRQSHTRLEVFAYQVTGVFAAAAAIDVWDAADPAGSFLGHQKPADVVWWWGRGIDARAFLLVSLAAFAAWTLIGCYRAMRLELKMRNGPLVWLGFLLFMGAYVAGFDAWLPKSIASHTGDVTALRLALAGTTFAVITYAMVLLEPKDRVLYRWMGDAMSKAHFGQVAWNLQGWMMSGKAAGLVAIALIAWLAQHQAVPAAMVVVAAMGFLTRDVGIFVLLQALPGQRRGDFAALATLFVLYLLAPAIAHGLDLNRSLLLFFPQASDPVWLSPAIAWGEALVIAGLAVMQLATGPKQVATPKQAAA